MIKLNLLEELVAFQKYDTLAKAAQHLSITQPSVTRGMQRLEQELGVTIFKREPNHISLTPVGKFAAQQAKKLLASNEKYISQVRNYALNQSIITVAANAPGPLMLLKTLKLPNIKIQKEPVLSNAENLLLRKQIVCFIINHPIHVKGIDSIYLGTENLDVYLNKFTALASQKAVSFKDLNNMTFIVFNNIGMWRPIIQNKIPSAKFLYQEKVSNFKTIRNNSIFPYFTTTITRFNHNWTNQKNDDRIQLRIKDPEAHQQFYACFLKENKKRLLPMIHKLQDQWAKADD